MPTKRRISECGWMPDPPDYRDVVYAAPPPILEDLPPAVDLRPACPPVYKQGPIGTCTANAIAGAIQFDRLKRGQTPDFVPSRLFIYFNQRQITCTVPTDSGATLRDGLKVLACYGVCPESDWPYLPTAPQSEGGPFPIGSPPADQPPQSCYAAAAEYRAILYRRITPVLSELKGCLAEGYPFVFGFSIYNSFTDHEGDLQVITPMPSSGDRVIGLHAAMAVGYDDDKNLFIVRNSWGPDEGENGYFYMPYAYLTDDSYSSDFWTIRIMSD